MAAGHRAVQDAVTPEHDRARVFTIWENCLIPCMVQIPDYARHVFVWHAELMRSPRDTEDAVRARIQRQQGLYRPGKKYRIMMWEGALRSLKIWPGNSFWIYDADSIATYMRVWKTSRNPRCVYGTDAQNLISAARRALSGEH
ncbi:Scr1 family TA system antitoxin-like transcriptional regulator [Streptomyces sp. NPDC050211]|uniref:Scr1 family TA system antitoxin-like transcriptional regulator n=1 Tax=Streptomyces sp. NPDC050211 TaxID=3154932 RepID=UPI00343D1E23